MLAPHNKHNCRINMHLKWANRKKSGSHSHNHMGKKKVNHKLIWILWCRISKCKACWQLKNCTCALLNNLMHSKLHTAAERSPMNSPKVFLQWPSWNLELQTQRPRLVHLPVISSFLVPSSSKLCNYRDECDTMWKALNMKGWFPMTQIENLKSINTEIPQQSCSVLFSITFQYIKTKM